MQTEAAPREPFTLGVLLRYKFTIFTVAVFVILGGYVKIITQPKQYEATARLAVRFSNEFLRLMDLERGGTPLRLPLLEEEVKALVVQLMDPKFIHRVLEQLPAEDPAAAGVAPETPVETTTAHRFRDQFLKAYYTLRSGVLSALDEVLFTDDAMVSEREQRVMKVVSKLEVSPGTEASHIITLSYKDKNASHAALMVNSIALQFIQEQKKTVKKKDEARFLKALGDETKLLASNKERFYTLTTELESPTLEEAIRKHFENLTLLQKQKDSLLIAQKLLEGGYVPYDRTLPLEGPQLSGELESEYFSVIMQFEEKGKSLLEDPEFYRNLYNKAQSVLEERRKKAIERDKLVVAAMIQRVNEEIERVQKDDKIARITPEYTRLMAEQTLIQQRVTKAEEDVVEMRAFNEQLDNENVSENVALWQQAQVPPFPLPQHRGLKLVVVIALGIFAGCAVALLRHQILPKPLRRARHRREDELDVPIIILPDGGKEDVEKDLRLNISFPADEAEEGSRGRRQR